MEKEIILDILIREEPEGGYSAICTNLEIASQGDTVDEALENVREAVELYLESAKELNMTDEVLDKLGLTKNDLKNGKILSKSFKTEIQVKITT
jgi:predicted RNase H-like HicB family nuclease